MPHGIATKAEVVLDRKIVFQESIFEEQSREISVLRLYHRENPETRAERREER
jgi:hypothetical protein